MPTEPSTPPREGLAEKGLVRLAIIAAIGGVLIGIVAAAFRIALDVVGEWWLHLLRWVRDLGDWRILLPIVGAGIAVGLARLIVTRVPESGGSGIQRVEATVRGEGPLTPIRILPAKFVGGLMAMGVGMALGREGPTVQMGAAVGAELGQRSHLDDTDTRLLHSAVAGAGLGVTFTAPLGGALFVLEELEHSVRTRLVIAVLMASSVSLVVAYPLLGHRPVFPAVAFDHGPWWQMPFFALLGLLAGAGGVAYNWLTLWLIDRFDSWRQLPVEVKAGLIGAVVGAVGVAAPWLVGGGEVLTARLLNVGYPLGTLVLIFVVRWFLGPLSYSSGVPGGLFAPLLLVGATLGALVATGLDLAAPGLALRPEAFAIVGMAAFFAGVVRAPFTGIVMTVEMTATTTVIVPMLLATGVTMVVCTLLRSTPIYDALRLRMQGQAVRF